MKKLLFILPIFLISCGNHLKKLYTEINVDTSKKTELHIDKKTNIDTGTIYTKKTIETLDTVSAINKEDSISGDSILTILEGNIKITSSYNKKTNKLTSKIEKPKEERKILQIEEKYEKKGSTIIIENKDSIGEQKNAIKIKQKLKNSDNRPNWTVIIISLVVFIVGIICLYIFGLPKLKKK